MADSKNEGRLSNFNFEVPVSPDLITFQNDKNEEIGKLSFDDNGDLHFTGNADEAAKVFFTAVVKLNNKRFDDLSTMGKMGYEVVQDFLPNVGQCALQDYGRLNDFMIMASKEYGGDE